MSAEPPPLFAERPAVPAEHMNDSAWRDDTDENDDDALDSNTAKLEPEPEVRARYARFVPSGRAC